MRRLPSAAVSPLRLCFRSLKPSRRRFAKIFLTCGSKRWSVATLEARRHYKLQVLAPGLKNSMSPKLCLFVVFGKSLLRLAL